MTSRLLVVLLAMVTLAGCAVEADDAEDQASTESDLEASDKGGTAAPLPESVQLLNNDGKNFCTGVVVNPNVVLTAGHCVNANTFTVIAPFAPGKPKRTARLAERLGTNFNDPTVRDIAVLHLDSPLNLDQFATTTDIGAQADGGSNFKGVAVGRATETRKGALLRTKTMAISSAKGKGYTHGLRTEWYSDGGDSGGPLFLVEGGAITHKLVGIERQPEPGKNEDFFTRIDGTVEAAIARHSK